MILEKYFFFQGFGVAFTEVMVGALLRTGMIMGNTDIMTVTGIMEIGDTTITPMTDGR